MNHNKGKTELARRRFSKLERLGRERGSSLNRSEEATGASQTMSGIYATVVGRTWLYLANDASQII